MKKRFLCFAIISMFLWINSSVAEKPDHHTPSAKKDKPLLEKITFIHFKEGHAKPPWAGGGKDKESTNNCYGFLGKGIKLKSTANYIINPTNPYGLTDGFVEDAIFSSFEEWDVYTDYELFSDVYLLDNLAAPGILDGANVLGWGFYPTPGVIAVTSIWGYFSGPPRTREIIEFDVTFNIDFDWGDASTNSSVMDLQNIATHEIGHCAGLDDLYESGCSAETMYGYSEYGETSKRELNSGDIEGIQSLYK